MNGPQIQRKIAMLRNQQIALIKQHDELSMSIITLIDSCKHENSRPYRACGIETNCCIYCGHEEYVRSY